MAQEVSKETQEIMDEYAGDLDIFYECLCSAADNFGSDTMKDELEAIAIDYCSYDLNELGRLMYNEIQDVMRRRAEAGQ